MTLNYKLSRTSWQLWMSNWFYAITGILFSAFALKGFLVPNHFLDGGVTGIALILHEILHINLSTLIILVNIPFIIMGLYQVSFRFAWMSLLCIALYAIGYWLIPFQMITNDKFMVSIFGGFFLGLGVGFAMRGGFTLDGIEVLALYTTKRSSFKISEVILGLNVLIFIIGAFFVSLVTALYAMLTYFIASKTIDYVIEGVDEYTGMTIISAESETIKEKLVKEFGRGITVYKGQRGFHKDSFEISQPCDILFTVVTRFEVRQMRIMVQDVDPKAFVFTNSINEIAGGVLKKKHVEH